MVTGPSLTLTLEKGPRRGETIECEPGGHVRIGRVLRGNTFTIKDPSISQKHVTIEFTSAGGGGGSWTLTDLDTSNGTFLNTALLEPLVQASLKHGDVIKIGEDTSISVQILEPEVEEEKPEEAPFAVVAKGRPKRAAATRKARGEASRLAAEAEEWKGKDSVAAAAVKRTGRARRNAAVADSTTQLPKDLTCPEDGPVEAEEHKDDPNVAEAEKRKGKDSVAGGAVKRTGRVRRNAAVADSTTQLPKDLTCPEDGPEAEQQKNDPSVLQPEKKPAQPPGRSGRRRGARKAIVEELVVSHPGAEEEGVIVLDTPDRHEVSDKPDDSKNQPVSGSAHRPVSCPVEDGVTAPASVAATTVVAESIVLGEADEDDADVEMNNMTLEQWFDRMEKVLPLMLKDVCDEIISDIKEKAQRYNAFVLESDKDGR